ncbi:MAG: carbohydrate ABC transporter permease, partial [Actinobacteria bacterium]|nr:carbohydrate ABC transporter permease [Actinomycetota bacterium]
MIYKMRWYQLLLLYFVITALAFTWGFPIVIMILRSLVGQGFLNYLAVIRLENFPLFFLNSFIITISVLIIRLSIVALAAFAFSKLKFPLKNFLFLAAIVGLMVPPFTLIVPIFQTIKSFHLINNILGVILPLTSFGIAFNLLLFKNYYDEIPNELLEAADIDGATDWFKFVKIILPLSKPIIITGGIFTFLNSWNEYLLPLVIIRDFNKAPVTFAPTYFQAAFTADYSKIFASLILISIPIIIVYLLGQRYLERG